MTPTTLLLYAPDWSKSTQKKLTSARYKPRLGSRNFHKLFLKSLEGVEEIHTFRGEGYCAAKRSDFWGCHPSMRRRKGWSRSDARSNKQRFDLDGDQTNNREQTNKQTKIVELV
jgi:hypothetical protein